MTTNARVLWVILVSTIACGGSHPPARVEPSPAPKASASADALPPARPGRLRRRDVMATLSRGLGDFLTRLELEPSLMGGKFRGWRIAKLRAGDPLWDGVDLAPGDVVIAVNGRPIERPEQALAAFQSMAVAPALRVAYERDGARREIVYPIDDDPGKSPTGGAPGKSPTGDDPPR